MIEDDAAELSQARTAVLLSSMGLVFLSTQCCSYFMGSFAGLVCGLVGAWIAYAQHELELGPATRAYNNVALWLGVVASLVGGAFSLFWALYIGMYLLMFVAVFAAGL